jgi:hypothetical protein
MKELFSESRGAQTVRRSGAISAASPLKAPAPHLSRDGKWIGGAALSGLLLGLFWYGDPNLRTALAIGLSVWIYSRTLRSSREADGRG